MEESPYIGSNLQEDKISYVIDFMDYYNPSERAHIMEFIDKGIIDGLGIRIGGSKMDYPFTIKNFTNEEIKSSLQGYIDNGQVELDHEYGLRLESAEEFIEKAPVTIPYYLTCCINNQEAEIEADCIEATYSLLQEHLNEYDFDNRMAPITIDIEDCGDEKLATDEDYLSRIDAINQRTEAVLHLVDCLVENGVIDER